MTFNSARLIQKLPPLARLLPLSYVLALQLVLTVFCPPIPWGIRSVFIGDLFFFLWPLPYLAKAWSERPQIRRRLLMTLCVSAVIAFVAFLHGSMRTTVTLQLMEAGWNGAKPSWITMDPDDFNLSREAVVAIRFLFWFWGALAAGYYTFDAKAVRFLRRTFVVVLLIATALGCACKFFPDFQDWLGTIVGYKPASYPWGGRVYGAFRSPIEGATFFGLAPFLIVEAGVSLSGFGWLALGGSALNIFFAQSGTTLVTWSFFILGFFVLRLSRGSANKTSRTAAVGAVSAFIGSLTLGLEDAQATQSVFSKQFLSDKWHNFVYRFEPWKVYWQAALHRWDILFLGMGFTNYHVDNSYVFLFNRGGLLLMGVFLGWLFSMILRGWAAWRWPERGAVLMLLISSMTVDAIIIRPMVALIVTVVIPILALRVRTVTVPLNRHAA